MEVQNSIVHLIHRCFEPVLALNSEQEKDQIPVKTVPAADAIGEREKMPKRSCWFIFSLLILCSKMSFTIRNSKRAALYSRRWWDFSWSIGTAVVWIGDKEVTKDIDEYSQNDDLDVPVPHPAKVTSEIVILECSSARELNLQLQHSGPTATNGSMLDSIPSTDDDFDEYNLNYESEGESSLEYKFWSVQILCICNRYALVMIITAPKAQYVGITSDDRLETHRMR